MHAPPVFQGLLALATHDDSHVALLGVRKQCSRNRWAFCLFVVDPEQLVADIDPRTFEQGTRAYDCRRETDARSAAGQPQQPLGSAARSIRRLARRILLAAELYSHLHIWAELGKVQSMRLM